MTAPARSHYELLGVPTTATTAEIRAAYLAAARRAHPDRHVGDAAAVAAAEERMRLLNAAWADLGDADRRAAYDRSIGLSGAAGRPAGAVVSRPSRDFTPHDSGRGAVGTDPHADAEDAAAEAWRHEPDPYDPRTGVGRILGAGPPLLFVVALALLVAGAMTGIRALVALAFAAALVALLAFIGVPIVAVARSKAHDRG